MKSTPALMIILLSVTLLTSAQQPPKPNPKWAQAAAEAIATGLRAVPWDSGSGSPHQWVEADGGRNYLGQERFQGDGSGGYGADEEWCFRDTLETKTHKEELYSYAFPPAEAIVCRFQQFRAFATGVSVAALEEVHQALAQRLSEWFGSPEGPEEVHDSGSAYWHHILRWQTEELEIVLYIDEPAYRQPRLGLRARHRHLLDALADDSRLYGVHYRLQALEKHLVKALIDELGDTVPVLASLLRSDASKPDVNEVATMLLRLLEIAETGESTRRPALLLAADRLANRLQYYPLLDLDKSSPVWDRLRQKLATYGLRYQGDKLGGGWVYLSDLLVKVWGEYPTTEWGEYAFVLLLNLGWEPNVACANGSDTFRTIIAKGEELVSERPESSRLLYVLFPVAQAYETWWSLSQASAKDAYVNPADYQDGANEARKRAIARYEEIVRLAPGSDEALYARRRLPRLRLRLDTNQRRYYCIYD